MFALVWSVFWLPCHKLVYMHNKHCFRLQTKRDYHSVLLGESETRCNFNLFQSFNSIDRFLCTFKFLQWYVFPTFLEKEKANNNNDNNKAGLLCSRFFCVCVSDRHKKWLETITKHDSQHFESEARFFSTPETKIHKSLSRWFYVTSLSVMKFFNYALKMSDVESFTS